MKIVFLHPDLGIGGAERLVVDAGLGLKRKGHSVTFVTGHHKPPHCFPETSDGTLDVIVVGDWLPRSVFGQFYALCAYVRMIYAALYIALGAPFRSADDSKIPKNIDLVICDQVSACIPVLRLFRYKVLFYCHFPDLLLSQKGSVLKQLYRLPLNLLEEFTTGMAHRVLVNSKFTEGVFRQTFTRLSNTEVDILYPTLNTANLSPPQSSGSNNTTYDSESLLKDVLPPRVRHMFLSINRYEHALKQRLTTVSQAANNEDSAAEEFDSVHLVIAGGYDSRVPENVEHFSELTRLADKFEIGQHITFLRSPSDEAKQALLSRCLALVYTPSNEHFGIVPLEAMYCQRPVLAVNSGGPLETVLDGRTGLLLPPNPAAFADGMARFVRMTRREWAEFGEAGHERVQKLFTPSSFTRKLNEICQEIVTRP